MEREENRRARQLQISPSAIAANHAKMKRFGAYCLMKVVSLVPDMPAIVEKAGYFTFLMEISGKTPGEIRRALGLRSVDLANGAAIYQLLHGPPADGFFPCGYSSLIDGLPITDEPTEYRPCQMAWQATLSRPVKMRLFATVLNGQRFEPGPHPQYRLVGGK